MAIIKIQTVVYALNAISLANFAPLLQIFALSATWAISGSSKVLVVLPAAPLVCMETILNKSACLTPRLIMSLQLMALYFYTVHSLT